MTEHLDGKLFSKIPKPLRPVLQPFRPKARQLEKDWNTLKLVVRNFFAVTHQEPLFVLGNQKTGSTAIAALLGMATGLTPSLDLTREIGQPTFRKLFENVLSFDDLIRRNRLSFSTPIIKDPNLTLFYEELANRFAAAKFAFIVRDPRDNIRSILNRVNLPGNLDQVQHSDLSHIDQGFMLVIDSRWCGIDSGPHYMDNLASRWNAMADVYLQNQEHMELIRYEDFKSDRVGEIERLAERIGFTIVRDISNYVNIQFQSKGDNTLAWADFFGPQNLSRIESICGNRLASFGYKVA